MYSFVYDESETWAVWPKGLDLLAFNDSSSDIVIQQIMRQLFDGVRNQMNELKLEIQEDNSQLTTKVNKLLAAFEGYRSDVQTNEVFVRYSVAIYSILYFVRRFKFVCLLISLLLNPVFHLGYKKLPVRFLRH